MSAYVLTSLAKADIFEIWSYIARSPCAVWLQDVLLSGRMQLGQSAVMQLTPEQERRIQAVVNSGAYPSAEDALDAALVVVEAAATAAFEGGDAELDRLLMDGL